MEPQNITVFGGSGFIGRYVVAALAEEGHRIRVAVRHPDSARHLKPLGTVGQITIIQANIREDVSVRKAIQGSDVVINLVGVLYEKGKQKFSTLQAQGAERIAKIAADCKTSRLIHMSALGVDKASGSHYARSKLNGEKAVISAFKKATILRPSIVFGPEDNFFNRFAHIATTFPYLPVIGKGQGRFQPIYVKDIAKAVVACLKQPETSGKVYELGGPRHYSFNALMEIVLQETESRASLLHIPFAVAKLMAIPCEWLPKPPLTCDQITLLRYDNIVSDNALSLDDLGIAPTPLETIVPQYLRRYRSGSRFAHQHPLNIE